MARRAARVDSNHGQIAEFFRAHGCEVESLARLGNGVPDLLVGWNLGRKRFGCLALVEVKAKGGKLTDPQIDFSRRFPTWIVQTESDALELVEWLQREKRR